jgi:hypothetical protein
MTRDRLELPALPYEEWAPTKKTLQMCAQMLGKARLALSPPQPQWLHTALYVDGRGFTTGAMPWGAGIVAMGIDVYATSMWVRASDGRGAVVELGDGRCVSDIWSHLRTALTGLGIDLDVWEKPQEVADTTPFSENTHDCAIVPEHAQRFYRVLASLDGVFEEFRSGFSGRTGVQLWWGAFDFAVLLFSGRQVAAPDDRGYIMRYDLDAELMNAGFWPGDDNAPTPGFYAYLHPRPDGCEIAPIEPAHAGWVESMGEWMMPYDAVRECDDPRRAILDFLDSVYRVAVTNGGWDADAHIYTRPPASTRLQRL